jgi:hypothetical protein
MASFRKEKDKTMLNYAMSEVTILVNGNSVAKYHKDGKVYVEAKEGSEYEISIKNHGSSRILAVTSVDGLNVLTGEQSSTEDSGYVVAGYSACKIKGFRYNDEKVGAFKFVKKSQSYAKSKKDGSVVNCGVIGVVVYEEHQPYADWVITSTSTGLYGNGSSSDPMRWNPMNEPYSTSANGVGGISNDYSSKSLSNTVSCASLNYSNTTSNVLRSFDMGSGWGKSKESKVTSTDFTRGDKTQRFEIYYASRESLIDMGVIQPKMNQVAFPKSFPKYAKPPSGWVE